MGFVGGGAMAEALISGILKSGLLPSTCIYVCDPLPERRNFLVDRYHIHADGDVHTFLKDMDVVLLAVKPQVADVVLSGLMGKVSAGTLILSIVTGTSVEELEARFPGNPVVRVMPNTPAAVGEGVSALAFGTAAQADDRDRAMAVFRSVGRVLAIEEKLMPAVTGLSGSGPGYVFVIIDALADAGVKVGLTRRDAITLAAQTLLGSAKMVLETGQHPAVLRDQVTSPGGTTIAGIHVMEQCGVRSALISAVEASAEKSKLMGKS